MDNNWGLIGHEWAVQLLKKQVASNRPRHAYLFVGAEGAGRRTLALRLAQALNCEAPPAPGECCGQCRACHGFGRGKHADLWIVERQEGDRDIKIDAIREVSRSLSRTPMEARYQIALLLDFELASEESANALLKTLEEPTPTVILCLTAQDEDSLPETIVSRCELIRLRPLNMGELAKHLTSKYEVPVEEARLLASLSGGCPGTAISWSRDRAVLMQRFEDLNDLEQLLSANMVQRFAFAEKASKDRDVLRNVLMTWLSFWRDLVLQSSGSQMAIANVDRQETITNLATKLGLEASSRAQQALEHTLTSLTTNVNARLALEGLLLQIPSV
jgi:DNA polymerase-3 subunit delta'